MTERQVVLIVDDDAAIRVVLADALELGGYEALVATSGREGIALARTAMPSLILMDLRMPVMDGIEAIAVLKDDPATQHIPIIALSAGNVLLDQIDRLRADCLIAKPFDLDMMLAAVRLQLQQGPAVAPQASTRTKGTGRLTPLPDGAELDGHHLTRLIGDGRVDQDDRRLAVVRYDLKLCTERLVVGGERVDGETTIAGTVRSAEGVHLPANATLTLVLEDGRRLSFITTGNGPEYAVLPVGDHLLTDPVVSPQPCLP